MSPFPPFTVEVPATTANLGPGFDCLGLALDIWNRVEVAPAEAPVVEVEGEGAERLARDARNRSLEPQMASIDGAHHFTGSANLRQARDRNPEK